MSHNFSFVLLVTALFFISACSSPQQKPTNTPQTPSPTSVTPPSPAITKTTQPLLVPTPYIPKPSQPKIAPVKKAVATAKPVQKKASVPSTPSTKTKPSKTAKKSPSIKTKPITTKKKLASITPTTKKVSKPAPVKKPKTTESTPKQKPKPTAALITPTEISVSLEALPLTIGPWTLSESRSLSNQCSLVSITHNMPDGQGNTPVYLEITQQHIILHTKSNIDTSYTDTGVFIGQQKVAPIEKLRTPTSVLFDSSYKSLVNTMKNHSSLEIKVGFWPSWPITQAYATTLKTGHFKTAYNALKKCNHML